MRRPTSIPPGRAGLIVLAIAFAPLVLSASKPLVRAAGRGLRKLGEAVENLAGNGSSEKAESSPTSETPQPEPAEDTKSNPEVKEPKPRAKKAKKA
jgi:hypothetical protein